MADASAAVQQFVCVCVHCITFGSLPNGVLMSMHNHANGVDLCSEMCIINNVSDAYISILCFVPRCWFVGLRQRFAQCAVDNHE